MTHHAGFRITVRTTIEPGVRGSGREHLLYFDLSFAWEEPDLSLGHSNKTWDIDRGSRIILTSGCHRLT